jgi:hypothetical protein
MNKRYLVFLVLLAGCRGELLATAKLNGPGTAETRFTTSKAVDLWSDFDGSWEAHSSSRYSAPPLNYDVQVVQGGNVVGQVSCTTVGTTQRVCGGFTRVGSSFSGNCEFRMSCSLPAVQAGEVVLRVTGRYAEPERIKSVSSMSLNVRAK